MATIDSKNLKSVRKLYSEGNCAREIAETLNVSLDSVYYFFRKHGIARRSREAVRQIVYKNKTASFKQKLDLSDREKELKIAGTMLYWAEGSKWQGEKIVDFANSDVEMIKMFLKFLRDIFQIDEKKLRVYLYCFENQDVEKLTKYWSRETKIPTSRFTKPYVKESSRTDNKMKNGLVHIRYADKKLLNLLRELINEYCLRYN